MKRYTLIVACVLIAGTSAWGYGLDSYNTCSYLPRCYTPGPCYQPPVCQPQPCPSSCYQQAAVTYGGISSSQNAILASSCGTGMSYANNCSGLMIYGQTGCRPTFQCETYHGFDVDFNGCGGFQIPVTSAMP